MLCRIVFCLVFGSLTVETLCAQEYVNLLDSRTLNHWMKPNGDDVGEGWQIQPDGTLRLNGRGGNMITREQYGDFELWFEFRVAAKGNNGIKYRVRQYNGSWLGIEYQVLDDNAFPKLTREHLTGSAYDIVEPIPQQTRLKGDGEFNIGKIRVHNQRIQHWVNGQLMINERVDTASWEEHVANSKFSNREKFGQNQTGHIMLTDHNSEVWYRNIYIRRLNSSACRVCCP